MNTSDVLGPLYGPIAAIQRLIEQFNDQGIIIGGVAASILGEPRLTADADAMLLLSFEQIPKNVLASGFNSSPNCLKCQKCGRTLKR